MQYPFRLVKKAEFTFEFSFLVDIFLKKLIQL